LGVPPPNGGGVLSALHGSLLQSLTQIPFVAYLCSFYYINCVKKEATNKIFDDGYIYEFYTYCEIRK